jgi:hypothetical protein
MRPRSASPRGWCKSVTGSCAESVCTVPRSRWGRALEQHHRPAVRREQARSDPHAACDCPPWHYFLPTARHRSSARGSNHTGCTAHRGRWRVCTVGNHTKHARTPHRAPPWEMRPAGKVFYIRRRQRREARRESTLALARPSPIMATPSARREARADVHEKTPKGAAGRMAAMRAGGRSCPRSSAGRAFAPHDATTLHGVGALPHAETGAPHCERLLLRSARAHIGLAVCAGDARPGGHGVVATS